MRGRMALLIALVLTLSLGTSAFADGGTRSEEREGKANDRRL